MEDCKTTYLYKMEIFDISKKCPPGKKPTLRERRMEQSRDVQTVRTQSVFVCCWRRRSFATAWRCPDGTKHWRKLWCTLLLCFNEFTSGFSGFVSCGVLCKARPEEEGTNRKGSKDKVPTNVVWIKVDFSSSSWSEFLVSHLVSTLLILQVDFAEERPATDLCSFDCPNQWPCIVYFPSQGILCFQDGPIASLQIYAPQEVFCVVESESCSSAEQAPIRAAAGAGALFGPGLWRQIFHSEVTRGNPCLMWEYLRLSKGARAKADWKPLCQFFDALTHEKYFEFKSLHVCAFFTGEKGSVICADLILQILPVWRNWWQKVPQLLLQLTRQCWRTGLSLGKLASTKIAICKKCFRRYSSKLLQCPSFKL